MKRSIFETIDTYNTLLPANITSGLWYEPDSHDLYKKNIMKQPRDWHYRTHHVKYDLNSLGYRTKELNEIDWENSIVIFGDSMVFGVGVSEEETISSQIERMTGIPTINLGISGASPILTLHNSMLLIQSFPAPKYIVSMWSTPSRFAYYNRDYVFNLGDWTTGKYETLVKEWNDNPYNNLTHFKFTVKITNELWKERTQYYEFTFFENVKHILKCDFIAQIDRGRDMREDVDGVYIAHPGRETYNVTANKIIDKFNLPRRT
jgi:hypothetical protein